MGKKINVYFKSEILTLNPNFHSKLMYIAWFHYKLSCFPNQWRFGRNLGHVARSLSKKPGSQRPRSGNRSVSSVSKSWWFSVRIGNLDGKRLPDMVNVYNVYVTMERSTMLLLGKLTISRAIFYTYVELPEGGIWNVFSIYLEFCVDEIKMIN